MSFCPKCGKELPPGARFCENCGCPVGEAPSPAESPAPRPQPAPRPAPAPRTRPPAPPKKKGKGARIAVIAVVLAVALVVTGFWHPGFFLRKDPVEGPVSSGEERPSGKPPAVEPGVLPSAFTDEELFSIESVPNPAPDPVSGTPAFKEKLAPGFTVSGEENALDRERTFTAEPLSEEKLDELFPVTLEWGGVPYAGFLMDAGLEAGELFPGTVQLDFDLKALGIPESIWDFCRVVTVDEAGTASELASTVENGVLTAHTNHNSIIVVSAVTAAVGGGVLYAIDQTRTEIPSDIYYKDEINDTRNGTVYSICYPASTARTDSPGYKEMKAREEAIWKQCIGEGSNDYDYANAGAPFFQRIGQNWNKWRGRAKTLADQPEYLEIEKKMRSTEWREKNFWPEAVQRVVKMLRYADEFDLGEFGFRPPRHRVEIYVIDNPTGNRDVLGYSINLTTSRPYMIIYKNAKGFENDTNLAITMAHELFHIIQTSRYILYDDREDSAFWEATAVAVEREAYRYFVKKGYVPKDDAQLTPRESWGDFLYPMMYYDEWDDIIEGTSFSDLSKEQGYTASYFIEFMRDRYYGKRGGARFLRKLMEEYSSVSNSTWIDAMIDATSGAEEAFEMDYLVFCAKNGQKFIDHRMDHTYNFDTGIPVKEKNWLIQRKDGGMYPVSCSIWKAHTHYTLTDFSIIVLQGDDPEAENNHAVLRFMDENGKALGSIRGFGRLELGEQRTIYYQSVNPTRTKSPVPFQIFYVGAPDDPVPVIRTNADTNKEEVAIECNKWAVPQLANTLHFYCGDSRLDVEAEPGVSTVTCPTQKLLEYFGVTKLDDIRVSSQTRVVARTEDEKASYGPESAIVPLKQEHARIEDFMGTYEGTYTNLKGESFPAAFTMEMCEVMSPTFAKVYVHYDFGEIRCDILKNDDGSLHYDQLVIQDDHVFLNSSFAEITFSPDARTMRWETTNLKGAHTTMTGVRKA